MLDTSGLQSSQIIITQYGNAGYAEFLATPNCGAVQLRFSWGEATLKYHRLHRRLLLFNPSGLLRNINE